MAYAVYGDVGGGGAGRLPGLPAFTSSTQPTQAQVTQWLTEADAFLNGALLAAGLTSPATDARALEILKSWACDYAEGHVRIALAAAGGDGSNDDGKDLVERFRKLVDPTDPDGIVANSAAFGAMLQGGDAGSGARRLRSHVLDYNDSSDPETLSDGDFDPVFSHTSDGSQF